MVDNTASGSRRPTVDSSSSSPPVTSVDGIGTPIKRRRVRTGCFQCRSRKVKCDETKDVCLACQRTGLTCRWPDQAEVSKQQHPGKRVRGVNASSANICSSCRAAKVRCSNQRPKCERCVSYQLSCVYGNGNGNTNTVDAQTTASASDAAAPSPSPAISLLPENHELIGPDGRSSSPRRAKSRPNKQPKEPLTGVSMRDLQDGPDLRSRCPTSPIMSPGRNTLQDIDYASTPSSASTFIQGYINAWFRFVHPQGANAFLHRGTLLRDVREGTTSPTLVLAICAAAGYFVLGAARRSGLTPQQPVKSDSWSGHAKSLLFNDDTISQDNLAAALVLNRHFIYCGRIVLADHMAAYALRQAALLGLYQDTVATASVVASNGALPWSQQEQRRRLLWACLHTNPVYTAGADQLAPQGGRGPLLQLPVEDHNFQLSIRTQTPITDMTAPCNFSVCDMNDGIGLMGHYIIITSLSREAQKLSAQLQVALDYTDLPWTPSSTFNRIATKIADWRTQLSSRLELTVDNIFARSLTHEETPLLMLHVWYHAAMWELHGIAQLPTVSEHAPVEWISATRTICVSHANTLSDVLAMFERLLPDHALIDPCLPLLIYQSVRIQLADAYAPDKVEMPPNKVALGERFDRMTSHVRRCIWLIWAAGYTIRLLDKLLRYYEIPTKYTIADGGPAAEVDLPPALSRVLKIADIPVLPRSTEPEQVSEPIASSLQVSMMTDISTLGVQSAFGADQQGMMSTETDSWDQPSANYADLLQLLMAEQPAGPENPFWLSVQQFM